MASFKAGQQCKLGYNYVDRIATSGIGATVYGQFDTTNLTIAGVSTFTGNIDANGDLDVDGHTNLDNVSIAGVSTFTGNIIANGNIGIGTDNPTQILHINDASPIIQFTDTNGLGSRINADSGNLYLDTHNNNRDIIFRGGNSSANEVARITGDGNIGIGTDNPLSLLSLYSDADDEELLHFDMGSPTDRRGWRFKQNLTGTTTRLNLQADANGKSFVVSAANDTEQFEVHTSSTAPYTKLLRRLHVNMDSPNETGGILVLSLIHI